MTTEDRRAHWRTIIDNQAASGMNIAAYCRESQIHSSLFYTWRRKLRKQQPCAGGFLELIPGKLTESAASSIRICLSQKLHVEVARGFDPFTQLFLLAKSLGKKQPVEWTEFVWQVLASQGQRIVKEGKTLETAEENLVELTAQATIFADKQLPILKALGIA